MLRFRLKMLKTAILTALVFVDQKPKPPPPRSLLIFELQNSVCAPAAASARMRIYLSYTRRHILCRSHQNCSFPGGRPLLNDKLVVVKPVLKKKHYASHQIGMSQLFYSDGNIRRWLAYSSDTTGIKFFFQYRLDYYILSFKKELLTRNEQFSSNFLTNFSLQYKICKLNKVSHFFTECNKRQRQVSQLFIIFVKQLLIFHIHDSLI